MLDDLWQASRDRIAVVDVVRRHGCDAGELWVRSWREDPAQAVIVEHYRALPDGRWPRASVAVATARVVATRAEFLAGLGRADLHRRGVLTDPEDAFFLTIPELVGRLPADAADLVAVRRRHFAEYAGLVLPDGWLESPEPRPVHCRERPRAPPR